MYIHFKQMQNFETEHPEKVVCDLQPILGFMKFVSVP